MKRALNRLTLYFETVPERLRRRRLWIWLLFVLTTAFFAFGITKVKFDMTLEGWFAEDDPIKISLDELHAEFGSDDGVFIVYRPVDGDVFSAKSLAAIKGIRDDLLNFRTRLQKGEESKLNHIVRINSLVNAPVLIAEDDTLLSKQLVGSQIPTRAETLAEIRKLAETQPDFPLLYFSKDFKYGGIYIETDFGTIPLNQPETGKDDFGTEGFDESMEADDLAMTVDETAVSERIKFQPTEMDDYLGLMAEINAVLAKPEYAQHLEYFPIGNAPMMEYGMEIMEEIKPMYFGMVLIMIVLLWYLFRSLSAVIWPISIVILSTVWTVGIAGWLDVTITTMLMLTIMLILAVGTADAIHLISGYTYFRAKGQNHAAALAHAYKKSALACLLTSLTTMIGMLSLVFTQIVHIQVFGYTSAFGVGLAFLFSIYLLPLMLDLWSPVIDIVDAEGSSGNLGKRLWFRLQALTHRILSVPGRIIPDFSRFLQRGLDQVIPIVQRGPYLITFLFLAVFAVCLYGASQVKVDSNMIEQFKKGTRIRDIYEIVDRKMMGTQNLEILLDLGEANAFHDPEVLKTVDRLQQTLAKKYQHLVVRTSSLANVVKDAYQTLNEDRPEAYIIPDDRRMLSQTLFLFNNANPEDRRKLVADDYRKSHISVQLYNSGSYEYTRVFADMRVDIDEAVRHLKITYPDLKVTITGGLALMMELSDYITWSQIKSLGLALVVISGILIFVFGSTRAGLIAVIPNMIPAVLTFGLLGLLGEPLDADTMIIAPIIIGIAVDDTIHFITHYRNEVLIDGDIIRALRTTIKEVGQAIVFTSLILGLGFSIMGFSSHLGSSNMGKYGTLAIFAALMCDLFLLPAAIMIFKPRFLSKRSLQPAQQPGERI